MTRVTVSHPGPAGRSQRVQISSLKTTTPFHWPLNVKAGRRFGLAASSRTLLPRAREGQRRPTTPQWGAVYFPALSFSDRTRPSISPRSRLERRVGSLRSARSHGSSNLHLQALPSISLPADGCFGGSQTMRCSARVPQASSTCACPVCSVLVGLRLPNHAAGPPPRWMLLTPLAPHRPVGQLKGSLRLSGGAPSNQVPKADL
jgi:hypothetical protein